MLPCSLPSFPQVWALALSPSRLISASLDATIVVRCFEPGAENRAGMEQGATAGGDSESDESDGSDVEEESGSEYGGESDSDSGNEAGSEQDA